jgi:hypothetical protein
MRTFKLIGGLVMVLAFCAFSVASASAEEILWRWLPGPAKESFSGKSGKAKLQEVKEGEKGGGAIDCETSELLLSFEGKNSELIENEARLELWFVHFLKCTSAGLPVESLGDKPNAILVHLEVHHCLIEKGRFGLLIKLLPVHLEVLAGGVPVALLLIEGAFIAEIKKTAANSYELIAEQKEGKQAIEKCEGGKVNTLLSKNGSEPQRNAGELVEKGTSSFDLVISKSEETLMET